MPKTAQPREIPFSAVVGGEQQQQPSIQPAAPGVEISFAEAIGPVEAQPRFDFYRRVAEPVLTSLREAVPTPSQELQTAVKRLPKIATGVRATLRSLGSSIDQAVADISATGEAAAAEQLATGQLQRQIRPGEHRWLGMSKIVEDVAAQVAVGAEERAFGAELESGRAARQTRRHMAEATAAIPADAGPIERAVHSGLTSAAITVPIVTVGALVPGAQIPALMSLGGMEGLQRYGELRALRVPEGEAAISAGLIGGLAGLTEAIPLGALAKKSPFVRQAAEFVVTDLLGENITSAATLIEDWNLQLRDDVTMKDIWETIQETTGATIVGAGAQLSVSGLMTGIINNANAKARFRNPDVKTPSSEELARRIQKDAEATGKRIGELEIDLAQKQPKPRVRLQPGQEVITPEELGIGIARTVAETPRAEVDPAKPQLTVDEDTGQVEVKSSVGELLAQENRQFLQVKRIDVAEAERGKGRAQEMMQTLADEVQRRGLTLASDFSVSQDQQRVYAALKQKGFEVKENPNSPGINGSKVSADPRVPVYEVTRQVEAPVAEPTITPQQQQIFASGPTLDSLPGGKFVQGKLTAWYTELIRNVNPEALGEQAKKTAATLAFHIARSSNLETANYGFAKDRLAFWQKMSAVDIRLFMRFFETGARFKDPVLQKAAENIRERNKEIFEQDRKNKIEYDPIDNYLYHSFEDGEGVSTYFEGKYGVKWGNPGFTKDREFALYEEAIKAGFTPKYTNPEEIMLARAHASDIAEMRIDLLKDLADQGLAREAKKGEEPPMGEWNYRRAPNGQGYWVDRTADQILHNHFDTKSLWNIGGIRGDIFKGAMFLKNSIVPSILALSLFHPIHLLAGMDSAANMVRYAKQMAVGKMNAITFFGKWLESLTLGAKGIPLYGIIDNPKIGYRLLNAITGRISANKLTKSDLLILQYVNEGGFIPTLSEQFKTNAAKSFRTALNQAITELPLNRTRSIEGGVKAAWYAPFAILDKLQKPMFERWIPAMKLASYTKDVKTAFETDPTLLQDVGRRRLALRKLAKSVDNRYGEMAYNTLFWNRMIKDAAVANMISLGWVFGFFREYGGAVSDISKAVTTKGKLTQKIAKGELDRPLFVMFYTLQTTLIGGLITWAMTGEPPEDLIDYLYPKTGDKDSRGEDKRVNTPFYPREIAAIAKHIEHEGVTSGLWHFISNKASGAIGMVRQWWTGRDWRGHEIRDPNSPLAQKTWDTLRASLADLEPISIQSIRESNRSAKDVVLGISGFGKAPQYATQTNTEASISSLYRRYFATAATPYETAILSNDRKQLARYYGEGKIEEYGELLDKMLEKYDLTATEQQRLARNVMQRGQDYNPYATMFERLTWQQQKRLLDKMTEDERAEYLPHANREHLRYSYEEPEESR